jgi:hypothetical protein
MNTPGGATAHPRDITLDTYRYLRGGMAVMIVVLGAAVIGERLAASCWQTSISAYYFTTAHSIFIAVLWALGVLFIVYKGSSDTEDVLLTLAGILAFIVAMVPTTRPVLLCGRHDFPADYSVKHAITNNVWAVVIALVIARAVSWWLYRRTKTTAPKSALGTISMYLLQAIVASGFAAFIFFPERFDANAHGIAAVIMFLAIITTVVTTAFLVSRQDDTKSAHRYLYGVLYDAIAAAMIVTLIAVVVLHLVLDSWNHWVIVVETALILEFTLYWVVQTVELWRTPDRFALLPDADQRHLAQRRRAHGPIGLSPEEAVETTRPPVRERLLRAL